MGTRSAGADEPQGGQADDDKAWVVIWYTQLRLHWQPP